MQPELPRPQLAESCYVTAVPDLKTTEEAAEQLGIAVRSVLHRAKLLGVEPSKKIGTAYLWSSSQIRLLARIRKPGRPRKPL